MPKIHMSDVLAKLLLKPKQYFIVSMHREENVDDLVVFNDFLTTLKGLTPKYLWPIIVSMQPRTRKKIDGLRPATVGSLITFFLSFGFLTSSEYKWDLIV